MALPGDTEPEIRLTFDKPPKDPSKGFVFGSDKPICDVYCGVAEDGIGREMFRITFNDNGDVTFRTMAQERATRVTYNIQEGGKHTDCTWIFFPEADKIRVRVADRIDFDVILPQNQSEKEHYETNRSSYLEASRSMISSMSQPRVTRLPNTRTTAEMSKLNMEPYYYRGGDRFLGQGTFGKVLL